MPTEYTAKQLNKARALLGAFDDPKPTHSKLTFKEISRRTGVPPAVVSALATDAEIEKPPRSTIKGLGRPKLKEPGTGKKLGQRSPHRARARELKSEGKSLRIIAETITREVRALEALQDPPPEKSFKISAEAIRQLLLEPDDTDEDK